MLPLRLFVYDPESGFLTNLGIAAYADGEIYSMGALDGKLYLCSYPGARLSVYDPKKPLRFGNQEDDNPRDLGPLGSGQDRPRAMIAGPMERCISGAILTMGSSAVPSVSMIQGKTRRGFIVTSWRIRALPPWPIS